MFAVVAAGLTQSRAAVTLAGATLREDEARTEKMPSPDWIPVIQNFVPRGTWDKVLSTDWPSLEKQSRANFATFTPA